MNSYETMQRLVAAKLATVNTNGYLDTFKYARRVMFDYLWDTDARLLECRGQTYDNQTGELVVAAPRKSFNYLENGWWKDVPLDTPVIAYKKYNGFMACVSRHRGQGIISTTGSTKSDFVKYAEEYIPAGNSTWLDDEFTLLYEIVHPDDPHIVDEPVGAHYLGCRSKTDGAFIPYGKTEDTYIGTLKGILAIAEVNTGEGFIAYNLHSDPDRLSPVKIKTPYYIGKKKLMRLSIKNCDIMYSNSQFIESLPKIWQQPAKALVDTFSKEEWINLEEQKRRKILEDLIGYT